MKKLQVGLKGSFHNNEDMINDQWTTIGDGPKRPKLYVFAAGGTGIRVIEALTMLTAAGYMDSTEYDIVPIIFDIDKENGNKHIVDKLLKSYLEIHQNSTVPSFFSHTMVPLYQTEKTFEFLPNNMEMNPKEKFQWYELFSKDKETAKLTESLFGNVADNGDNEEFFIYDHFSSLNRARLALGDTSTQDDFYMLLKNVEPKDRFVIIGSLFGNTGAAVLFELTNTLERYFPDIHKAAIMLMPFYNLRTNSIPDQCLEQRSKSMLDFLIKIKFHRMTDYTYLIGADTKSFVEFSEGGQQQMTPNSIFEMIAATAVADFTKKEVCHSKGSDSQFLYFSMMRKPEDYYRLSDLIDVDSEKTLVTGLAKFSLAMKFILYNDKNDNDPQTKSLMEFAHHFQRWVDSMRDVGNGNGLRLFYLHDTALHTFIEDVKLTKRDKLYSVLHNGQERPLFTSEDFKKAMGNDKEMTLIDKLYQATNYIFANHISI